MYRKPWNQQNFLCKRALECGLPFSNATSCSREELFSCWILGLLCLGFCKVPISVPPALPNEHDDVFQCWKEFLVVFSISCSNMFFAILDEVLQPTPQGGPSPSQKQVLMSATQKHHDLISLMSFSSCVSGNLPCFCHPEGR